MQAQKLRVYSRLQMAAHKIKKAADRALLEHTGLTTAQLGVISVIQAEKKTTQRDIARQLGLNESAITAMTGKLIEAGLVQKQRSPTDARAFELSLTDEGQQEAGHAAEVFRTINQGMSDVLTEDEVTQFADYLMRISERFS